MHSVGEVFFVFDRLLVGGEEAGPAASGVEFGSGFKKEDATGSAVVFAYAFEVPVFASEGAFGAVVAEDLVLVGGELFAPFFGGLFDGVLFVGHLVYLTLGTGGLLAGNFLFGAEAIRLRIGEGLASGRTKNFSKKSNGTTSPPGPPLH